MKTCAILIVLIMGAGCFPIGRETPEKRQFVLDVSRPPGGKSERAYGVLRVNEFRAPQQYEGREFKYRMDQLTFQSDFYNEFFVVPGQMVAEETRQWLDQSGIFKDVVADADDQPGPAYTLDGTIQELYGDYSSNIPKAVMAIDFVLLKDVRGRSNVVFKKSYREEKPASGKSAKELAEAWNQDLFSILQAFERDLQSKAQPL